MGVPGVIQDFIQETLEQYANSYDIAVNTVTVTGTVSPHSKINTISNTTSASTSGESVVISQGDAGFDFTNPQELARQATDDDGAVELADNGNLVISAPILSGVAKYSLSTPYDLSTYSGPNQSVSISYIPRDIRMSDDGTTMWIIDDNSPPVVREFSLSTAFDLSTLSETTTNFTTSAAGSNYGLDIGPNGNYMYVSGYDDAIYQYSLSTSFDVSTASLDGSIAAPYQQGNSVDVFPNGEYLLVSGNYDVDVYEMSTPFDISTASNIANFGNSGSGVDGVRDGVERYVYASDIGDGDVAQWDVKRPMSLTLSDSDTEAGNEIVVKQNNATGTEVTATGTVDGAASYTIDNDGDYVRFVSDGTDWYVIG